jgi:ABC-type glycerol-3-phosphate transport system permease component
MKFKIFHSSFNRSWWGNLLVFMFLAVFGLFFIFPIFYSVLNAFKPLEEILIFPPRLYSENPTFDNFLELAMLMEDSWVPLSRYLFNSAIVSILGTAGHLLLSSMAAYPMAKINFPGRKVFQKVIVMSLLFSASVTYIPTYIVMDQLHLIDNPLAVILPAWASSLGLYLMMNFMTNLPDSMLEAARIDGASEFRIYWQIVMPNVKPAWMTLIIFSFQAMWNNTGASYLYSEELKMLPSIIGTITAGGVRRTGVSAAAALLMMLPPILIFVFSQNNVIETMSSSGLKE